MPDFLAACRGEPVDRVPVWFMRQAGRSLPEYRAIRGSGSILDAIGDPSLACEITLQPVRRYGVDAAILFSDIVVPYHAIGFGVDVVAGRGPVIARPFTDASDLDRLRDIEPADIEHVTSTVDLVVKELDATSTPLIGFAGAPFTVASYLVEGAPTREFAVIKTMMHADPSLFDRLLDRLVSITISFLRAQVAHGASAVQLFDSWAGALTRAEYERFALPATKRVLEGIVDLALEATREVLSRAGRSPGHIFNLGHGVLPATDPDVLEQVVRVVHDEGRAGVR